MTSLSAQGYQLMAVAGIFSGQMFNFMVGFGLSALLKSVRSRGESFRLFDWQRKSQAPNYMLAVAFAALLLNLAYVFVKMAKVNKFKLFKHDAYVAVAFYLSVLSLLVYIQFSSPRVYED